MYNWLHKHIFYFSTQTVQTLYKDHPWLLKALNTSLETAVQLIDTGPVWQLPHDVKWNSKNLKFTKDYDLQNCLNIHEVAIVVTLVKALLKVSRLLESTNDQQCPTGRRTRQQHRRNRNL